MTPTPTPQPLTKTDIARIRLDLRRAAKARVVAQDAHYSGQYA